MLQERRGWGGRRQDSSGMRAFQVVCSLVHSKGSLTRVVTESELAETAIRYGWKERWRILVAGGSGKGGREWVVLGKLGGRGVCGGEQRPE